MLPIVTKLKTTTVQGWENNDESRIEKGKLIEHAISENNNKKKNIVQRLKNKIRTSTMKAIPPFLKNKKQTFQIYVKEQNHLFFVLFSIFFFRI